MTEELTTPAPDSPEYQIFQIFTNKEAFKKIALAMKYAGETDAESFIVTCVKEHTKQITAAYEGTVLREMNTLTLDSCPYSSTGLDNAFEYGSYERENAQTEPPRPRPTLTALNGGKA